MNKDSVDGRSAQNPAAIDSVEYLLGQLAPEDAMDFEAQAAADPALAVDLAITNQLLRRLRALPVPTTGVAAVRTRARLLRRARLLDPRPIRRLPLAVEVLLIAAVLVLGSLLSLRGTTAAQGVSAQLVHTVAAVPSELLREQGRPGLLRSNAGLPNPGPHQDPGQRRVLNPPAHGGSGGPRHAGDLAVAQMTPSPFHGEIVSAEQEALDESLRSAAQAMAVLSDPDVFASLVAADNGLALLRMEFRQRYSPQSRRETIRLSGGNAVLEDRIQDLAADVAQRFTGTGISSASATDLSVGLRALLASGSTARIGTHREVVRQLGEDLVRRIPELKAGELAVALSALTDLAIVAGGPLETVVGQQTERLVTSLLASTAAVPSPLLRWSTPAAMLGEAGRVLSLAPAFGVHPTWCHRARMAVFDHLQERLGSGAYERPDVLAALVYGFCDLVDRDEIDRRLVLWPPRQIARNSMAAVHHLAWSIYPPRPALAQWQRDLRGLAALKTPAATADAASLLLCLTTSYAAPGVAQVLALVGR